MVLTWLAMNDSSLSFSMPAILKFKRNGVSKK
jgi:hypothetical protein